MQVLKGFSGCRNVILKPHTLTSKCPCKDAAVLVAGCRFRVEGLVGWEVQYRAQGSDLEVYSILFEGEIGVLPGLSWDRPNSHNGIETPTSYT